MPGSWQIVFHRRFSKYPIGDTISSEAKISYMRNCTWARDCDDVRESVFRAVGLNKLLIGPDADPDQVKWPLLHEVPALFPSSPEGDSCSVSVARQLPLGPTLRDEGLQGSWDLGPVPNSVANQWMKCAKLNVSRNGDSKSPRWGWLE